MPRLVARGPDNDHHSSAKMADSHDPAFSIVFPVIRQIQCQTLENLDHILEVETPFGRVRSRFSGS